MFIKIPMGHALLPVLFLAQKYDIRPFQGRASSLVYLVIKSLFLHSRPSRELVLIHNFKRLDFSPKKDRRFACPFFGAEVRHTAFQGRASSLVCLVIKSPFLHSRSSRELVLIHNFKRLDFSPKKDRRFACPFFGAEDEI